MNCLALETTSVWECPKLTSCLLGCLGGLHVWVACGLAAQPQEPGERRVSSAGAPVGLRLVFWECIKQQHPWTWLIIESLVTEPWNHGL